MHEDRDDAVRHGRAHDEAIEWWVAIKAGALSAEAQSEFEAWLAGDPANAPAYRDIAQMYETARTLRSAPRSREASPVSRRALRSGALALAVASLVLFVWFDDLSVFFRADHQTGVGETKSVTLADGSRIELGARSAIAVRYEESRRRVALLEGEAWFQVAPEPSRPFVVEAAGGTITALGTAFNVAVEKSQARVTVGEHRVAVSSGKDALIVDEGQETFYGADVDATAPRSVGLDNVAAWRRGALVVEDRPLGEVLSALGRYRRGFVYCVHAATCARRVSGVFATNEPLRALREIEFFLGIRAIRLTNYLILLNE